MRILAKRQNKAYEKEQNRFEDIQKKKIIDKINQELLKEKTRKSARYEYGENIPNSS